MDIKNELKIAARLFFRFLPVTIGFGLLAGLTAALIILGVRPDIITWKA